MAVKGKRSKDIQADDLVVDLPKPIQQAILKLFILPFRPKKTKDAYASLQHLFCDMRVYIF